MFQVLVYIIYGFSCRGELTQVTVLINNGKTFTKDELTPTTS